jgi:hypothetical protein
MSDNLLSDYHYNRLGGIDANRTLETGEVVPYTLSAQDISAIPAGTEIAPYAPPTITLEQIAAEYEHALEQHTDAVAIAGPGGGLITFRSAESAVSYADDPDPDVAAAVQAFKTWRSEFWRAATLIKSDVLAGLRPVPTLAEAIAELPQIQWPE